MTDPRLTLLPLPYGIQTGRKEYILRCETDAGVIEYPAWLAFQPAIPAEAGQKVAPSHCQYSIVLVVPQSGAWLEDGRVYRVGVERGNERYEFNARLAVATIRPDTTPPRVSPQQWAVAVAEPMAWIRPGPNMRSEFRVSMARWTRAFGVSVSPAVAADEEE